MNPILRKVVLGNGLSLELRDHSNRYFGDFHRILIDIDLKIETGDEPIRLRYQRPLRKMGVAGADLDQEKALLIRHFLTTSKPYMLKIDFPQKVLEAAHRPDQKIWKRLAPSDN